MELLCGQRRAWALTNAIGKLWAIESMGKKVTLEQREVNNERLKWSLVSAGGVR